MSGIRDEKFVREELDDARAKLRKLYDIEYTVYQRGSSIDFVSLR